MAADNKTITVRLPIGTFNKLESEIVRRRKKTGEAITRTKVITDALDEYLKGK